MHLVRFGLVTLVSLTSACQDEPLTPTELQPDLVAVEPQQCEVSEKCLQGIQGPTGPQGERGLDGRDGEVGPAGPRGERGFDGRDGEVGPAGPRGPAGSDGSSCSVIRDNRGVAIVCDDGTIEEITTVSDSCTRPSIPEVTEGLVLHMPFNGDVTERISGLSASPVLVGQPSFANGDCGASFISFTGYALTLPDSPALDIDGEISVAFWANNSYASLDWNVLSKGKFGRLAPHTNYHVSFYSNNSSNRFGIEYTTGGESLSPPPSAIRDGTWHFYVFSLSRSSSKFRFYLNGDLIAERSIPGASSWPSPNGDPLVIGARRQPDVSNAYEGEYRGLLDDLRIYSRELNQSEVRTIMHNRM